MRNSNDGGCSADDNNVLSDDHTNNQLLTDAHLIRINAVVAGLEVVSAVVFALVPPMLLKLGYSETQMSIMFGVGKRLILFQVYIYIYIYIYI